MELVEALTVVKSLSNGRNPVNGEVFSTESPYQQPPIIRALFWAVKTMEKAIEVDRRRLNRPSNMGKEWTAEEEERLAAQFDAGISVFDLARNHNRTRGAVTARLIKLGKISEDELYGSIMMRRGPGH